MITSKMWPLECQQGFPLIWPGDLVSDIKWPSFKLDLEIIKTNSLSNIYDDYLKSVTSGELTRVSFDLAWWPSFWPHLTQFQTWPRNLVSSRQTIWARFMMIAWKMWPLECLQGFSLIWPGDLVFYPMWPSFKLGLEIIRTNNLSKIHDDWKMWRLECLEDFSLIWPGD